MASGAGAIHLTQNAHFGSSGNQAYAHGGPGSVFTQNAYEGSGPNFMNTFSRGASTSVQNAFGASQAQTVNYAGDGGKAFQNGYVYGKWRTLEDIFNLNVLNSQTLNN